MKIVGLTPHFSQMVIYWLKMNILFFSQHIEIGYLSFLFFHILVQFELSIFIYKELIRLIELNT